MYTNMNICFRSKLNTQSKGTVKLDIYVLLRNFAKFGVEYK